MTKKQFALDWIDSGREPRDAPDPAFPAGIDIKLARPTEKSCTAALPYPAKRCGFYLIVCSECGARTAVSTAGRADDPRSVTIPCKGKLQ